ncbi:MAG: thioredoxin domain-containing protein [Lewinellaceae bacterium]|nr:thioredoxin domain-containing protein [Lewinellaceae bacterium]
MNQLKNENSPYLRQHADNPVNWQPWGVAVLERARKEDKPILLSIGYSTCHWCHVMARESFEDDEVAAYMNDHFINIKVDREERPDLDALYMAACEAITGKGGWPLNVFLTPQGRPYFAGTYFPPQPGQRIQSWMQALQYAAYNFYENRRAVEREAEKVLARMERRERITPLPVGSKLFSTETVNQLFDTLRQQFDTSYGGFGQGAKFPNTMALEFLMHYAWHTSSLPAFHQLLLSLDAMLRGGIRGHLEGGFARYTTDRQWRIPHFEKMLYDNALIARLLADIYKWTKKGKYRSALLETLSFLEGYLGRPEGGFYAALDAESGGQEGGYYTWNHNEVAELLGAEAGWFIEYYNISKEGNWEGRNIPYATQSIKEFAQSKGIGLADMEGFLKRCWQKLKVKQIQRPRPRHDKKLILPWNALAVTAYARAYGATSNRQFLNVAGQTMAFILDHGRKQDGTLLHLCRRNIPAFLDGYAYLAEALLELHSVTQQPGWLATAEELMEKARELFWEESAGLFYYSATKNTGGPLRQLPVREEDMPNPNAVMASNLQRLGLLLDKPEWQELSRRMLLAAGNLLLESPLPYARWATLLTAEVYGRLEIAIVGPQAGEKVREANSEFLGHHVLMSSEKPDDSHPLLAHRWPADGQTLIYVCKDYACRQPVKEVEEIYLID